MFCIFVDLCSQEFWQIRSNYLTRGPLDRITSSGKKSNIRKGEHIYFQFLRFVISYKFQIIKMKMCDTCTNLKNPAFIKEEVEEVPPMSMVFSRLENPSRLNEIITSRKFRKSENSIIGEEFNFQDWSKKNSRLKKLLIWKDTNKKN